MSALVVLAVVLIVLVASYLAYSASSAVLRRQGRPAGSVPAGWQLLHYVQDGCTVVAVARESAEGHVIEKHVVARIPDTDENWSRKFVEAKLDAEERAFHLNADRSSGDR